LLAVTGTPDAPAKVGISLADIGAGLHAYTAILEARMNSVEEFANHPQLRLTTIDTPAGSVTLPAPPVPYQDTAETPRPSVPALGEHTEAIRNEFGDRCDNVG